LLRGRAPAPCSELDAPMRATWSAAVAANLRARIAGSDAGLPARTVDRILGDLDAYAARWTSARTQACLDGQKGVRSKEVTDGRMRCLDQRLVEVSSVVEGLLDADADAKRRVALR